MSAGYGETEPSRQLSVFLATLSDLSRPALSAVAG